MPIFLSEIESLDEQPEREFGVVIDLDKMAEAGIRKVEFIECEPTPDEIEIAEKYGWRHWFDNYQEMLNTAAATIQLLNQRDDRIREFEAQIQNFKFLSDEMNGRMGDLLEAYEEAVEGNQALLHRAESAEAELAAYRGWLEGFGVEHLDSLANKSADEARSWGCAAASIHELTLARANRACEERSQAEAELAEAKKRLVQLTAVLSRIGKNPDPETWTDEKTQQFLQVFFDLVDSTQYHPMHDGCRAKLAEAQRLEDFERDRAVASEAREAALKVVIDEHRRFHCKVGCLLPPDCRVCCAEAAYDIAHNETR